MALARCCSPLSCRRKPLQRRLLSRRQLPGDSPAHDRVPGPREASCSALRRRSIRSDPRRQAVRQRSGQILTKQVVLVSGERITEVGPEGQVRIPAGVQVIDLSQATVLPGLIDAHSHIYDTRRPNMDDREVGAHRHSERAGRSASAGFTAMRDMGSHSNGYGDVDIRNAINWGDIDGPRLQVSGRGIAWGPKPADPSAPANPLASIVDSIGRGGARGRSRARRARRGLDQAASDRRLLLHADGRSAVRADVPAAGAAGARGRGASSRTQDGLSRVRRRGAAERDHRRLRHDRARLRPDASRSSTRWCRKGSPSIRRSSAIPSRTWTTTTPRTRAASSG